MLDPYMFVHLVINAFILAQINSKFKITININKGINKGIIEI